MAVCRHPSASARVVCSSVEARAESATWIRRLCNIIVSVAGLLLAVAAQADATAIELHAQGVQIYVCEQASDAPAWRLKGPEAILRDATGSEAGRHFFGPSWQANDGSTVVGEPMTSSRSPADGSIPWLVLRAKSHANSGILSSVDYVVRLHTEGGVAPVDGCDRSHVGEEKRIGYTATYVYFSH
jgi:Protein of unknown function (DUF3455)